MTTNLVANVSSMYEGAISIEIYSAGASRDVANMVDIEYLKCTSTLPLNMVIEAWNKKKKQK